MTLLFCSLAENENVKHVHQVCTLLLNYPSLNATHPLQLRAECREFGLTQRPEGSLANAAPVSERLALEIVYSRGPGQHVVQISRSQLCRNSAVLL